MHNKKIITGMVLWCLGGILPGSVLAITPSLAVIKSKDIPLINDSVAGLKDFLAEQLQKKVQLDEYLFTEENLKNLKKYDVYVAVGTEAAVGIKAAIQDKPIVFVSVLNPLESNLVKSFDASDNNVTGASLNVSYVQQLHQLKELCPHLKRLGLMYNPQSSNTQIREFKQAAGNDFEVVSLEVSKPHEVANAFAVLADKVDGVFLIPDVTVCTKDSLEYLMTQAALKKILVIGFSLSLARVGATVSFLHDFKDVGRQAGELVLKVLGGDDPGKLATTKTRKFKYVINKKVADHIGVSFSTKALEGAYEIIE